MAALPLHLERVKMEEIKYTKHAFNPRQKSCLEKAAHILLLVQQVHT